MKKITKYNFCKMNIKIKKMLFFPHFRRMKILVRIGIPSLNRIRENINKIKGSWKIL